MHSDHSDSGVYCDSSEPSYTHCDSGIWCDAAGTHSNHCNTTPSGYNDSAHSDSGAWNNYADAWIDGCGHDDSAPELCDGAFQGGFHDNWAACHNDVAHTNVPHSDIPFDNSTHSNVPFDNTAHTDSPHSNTCYNHQDQILGYHANGGAHDNWNNYYGPDGGCVIHHNTPGYSYGHGDGYSAHEHTGFSDWPDFGNTPHSDWSDFGNTPHSDWSDFGNTPHSDWSDFGNTPHSDVAHSDTAFVNFVNHTDTVV